MADVSLRRGDGVAADVGRLASEQGRPLTVGVIETGAGNVDAAVLTSAAEAMLRPSTIVMVGVAGGLKDVRIGDVVASSKIYWIEGGREGARFLPRPEVAAISPALVQLARKIAADGSWISRIRPSPSSAATAEPAAIVAPIAAGEKVVADSESTLAQVVRESYSDAVAVAMEEFGVTRGGGASERARLIAVRGISDLVDRKTEAEAGGSQPSAAAHAAAFAFELLDAFTDRRLATRVGTDDLARLGADLYPAGPNQDGLWERAGGDPSRLESSGTGFAKWWHAARLLEQGGGGELTQRMLLAAIAGDFPNNGKVSQYLGPLE